MSTKTDRLWRFLAILGTVAALVFVARAADTKGIGGFSGGGAKPVWQPPAVWKTIHPFRKVGEAYVDIRPVQRWYLSREANINFNAPNPMPGWEMWGSDKVLQVVPGKGLMMNSGGASRFLTNYPGFENLTDGARISYLAKRVGTFGYETAVGAHATVAMLDYGVPFDPAAIAREKAAEQAARTNLASGLATNSSALTTKASSGATNRVGTP